MTPVGFRIFFITEHNIYLFILCLIIVLVIWRCNFEFGLCLFYSLLIYHVTQPFPLARPLTLVLYHFVGAWACV